METLRLGSRGPDVQLLQLALTRSGETPGGLDGIFGLGTLGTLRSFQRRAGLVPDGIAGPRTWAALHPALTGYLIHTLAPGDSFWSLARRYGTTAAAIAVANPQLNPNNLPIGRRVVVPLGFPVVTAQIDYTSTLVELILEGLGARYPFLTISSMGRSSLGRPLYVAAMGQGDRQVFYNASHHANEWITTPVLLNFLEEYAQAYTQGTPIFGTSATQLYQNVTLFLAPLVNPDGVDLVTGGIPAGSPAYNQALEMARRYPDIPFPSGWKANLRGVDLNLNYPANWETAKEIKYAQGFTTPGPRDFVGPSPLSEPESRAVYSFTRSHSFELTLSYHSQGKIIYWKYLDYLPAGSYEIALEMGRVSGYSVEETPAASGYAGYKDWFIQTYDRPGYTIEVGRGVNPLPLSQFPSIYRDNLGILVVGMAPEWKEREIVE